MVSHVQLLARALRIPNVVVAPAAYETIKPHDGAEVFFAATPGGRVILKEAAAMDATDTQVFDEFNRNAKRSGDGELQGRRAISWKNRRPQNPLELEKCCLYTVTTCGL